MVQLIGLIRKEFPKADPERIYCTGISMGGFGTFTLSTTYPELFTAVCCVSGSGRPNRADRLKNVPTMIIHGGADGVVSPQGARAMEAKIKELGQTVQLHIFDVHGHAYYPDIYLPLTLNFFAQYTKSGLGRTP
jgi:predicted peptidase